MLDNCEHLLDAAADVVDQLLDTTRHLTVLATSREGLHVDGETMVQVPSLPLETDAVRMFRERASASGAGEVDDEIARRICERLDGLPLAIELAAARSGQLGAAEVAQRLSDRFQLLTGPGRRVPRQRTLEATLDWSHDLLHDDEKRALRRLAVFSGTFSLLAAEKVASAPADLIGSLVDKSLVQRGADGRFRLLDTVRAYAEDRLIEAGEGEEVRRAHVAWLVDQIGSFTDEEVILATSERSDEFVAAELEKFFGMELGVHDAHARQRTGRLKGRSAVENPEIVTTGDVRVVEAGAGRALPFLDGSVMSFLARRRYARGRVVLGVRAPRGGGRDHLPTFITDMTSCSTWSTGT